MSSIRTRLMVTIGAAFCVVWIFAGVLIYYAFRAGLIAGIERDVASMTRQARMWQMRAGGAPLPGLEGGSGVYWQVWPESGSVLKYPEGLAFDLPRLGAGLGETVSRRLTLENGARVWVANSRFGMGMNRAEVSVAKDMEPVLRRLEWARGMIIGGGLALGAGVLIGVGYVIDRGLAPMNGIADRVARIDPDSDDATLDAGDTPREIEPMISRLNDLLTRVRASLDRERAFSANLAHELRTPVTELKLLAEAARSWPDEEGGPEAWGAVDRSVSRIAEVVDSLLRLARLERGVEAVDARPIPLRALVEEIFEEFRDLARSRELSIHVDIGSDMTILGELALWRRAFVNLIGNAVEYADGKTTIYVSARASDDGSAQGVEIRNRASGLDESGVSHLFERFWRGDASRSDGSHSGLGGALAKALVEAMGWDVNARFDRGDGALRIQLFEKNAGLSS